MPNSLSGHQAPGFRFRFHIRSISHRAIFLTIEMKSLPEIQRLLKGESFLSVFNASTIMEARKAFHHLRYNYDFAFWAAREYYVRDIKDADNIIPLVLNEYQSYFIDIFQKRYFNQELGRYMRAALGFGQW